MFDAAHPKSPYAPGKRVNTVKVTAMVENSTGRKTPRTRNVDLAEVRTAAVDAGIKIGSRGRVPMDVQKAYVADTLSEYAASQSGEVAAEAPPTVEV